MRIVAKTANALIAIAALGVAASSNAAERSFKAEVLFKLQNPCPSTGEIRGECKGYVIDRVVPLACGGAEEPSNMQWQTLAQAREKDRWEKIGCRPGRKLVMPTPAVEPDVFPLTNVPEQVQSAPLPR